VIVVTAFILFSELTASATNDQYRWQEMSFHNCTTG
jgi:hypothetical protein